MATLEEAIAIAAQAHRGQTDRAGAPYILHPLRMMFAVRTDAERMAAVLHDVVEDTDWTLDALRGRGFSDEVIDAVDHLTRREGETYDDFVRRAARHPVARRVKLADLEDNMDARRLGTVTPDDVERLARYHRACRFLTDESARQPGTGEIRG
ncbi:HD domain-containing protein [Longimicrobium sp.]|uniref:HD domain-containing protein n=1 Tax=Longimicrobium sp. TaxID=2029185 RepID=UPI002E31DAE8|nr:HD domain-containing protein [Longimicrobium sp.]HEX6041952.1 HD domain-containing protein [Longimicrobium sp.]